MNILHISSHDMRGAGSATVAFNTLLNERGHRSRLFVVLKTKKDPAIIGHITLHNKRIIRWTDRFILAFHHLQAHCKAGKRNPDYYFYNLDEKKSNFSAHYILSKIDFRPDVIFLHWVSNVVNAREIAELHRLTSAKILWLMTDDAPITGGCHYPWNCKGYETYCADCPALCNSAKKHIAQTNLSLKKRYLPPLFLLVFSSIDKRRAENCSWYAPHKAHLIYLPIDEKKFRPIPMAEAQAALNLPMGKKIIFFAATDISERRKGYAELQEALRLFEEKLTEEGANLRDYLVVTAGKCARRQRSVGNIPSLHLGYLSADKMVLAFNAAAVFVLPVLEDSGPGITWSISPVRYACCGVQYGSRCRLSCRKQRRLSCAARRLRRPCTGNLRYCRLAAAGLCGDAGTLPQHCNGTMLIHSGRTGGRKDISRVNFNFPLINFLFSP